LDQLNFIVDSKTINENVMDTNLERLGINQKNKKKIKAATTKPNIHGLLNILKTYYVNTLAPRLTKADNERRDRRSTTRDRYTTDSKQTPPAYQPRRNKISHQTPTRRGKNVPNDQFMREPIPP
jgi:hypothetical protein